MGMAVEATNCMMFPNLILMANLYARVATYDLSGEIDPVEGLANDRVFVFHGTEDSVVDPGQCSHLTLTCLARIEVG